VKSYTLIISIILLLLITAACGSTPQDASEGASAAGSVQAEEGAQGAAAQKSDTQEVDAQKPEAAADTSSENQEAPQPDSQSTREPGFNREMPLAMTLALGTFKLEGNELAVNADQAAEMLTLWKAARSLSESDTTAKEELEAVVDQIQGVFTSGQLAEIETMELTFQDMQTVAEQMGIELGFGGRFGDMTPEQQATMQAARESGQAPQGGPGGGIPGGGPGGGGPGGGPGGGAGLSPEMRETAMAERGGFQRVNLGLPGPILEAVIEFLESKAG
jgi:hypothetical protein